MNKIFGYILKSKGFTSFPYLGNSCTDRPDSCGHFRRNIGDAKVYKTLRGASQFPSLEVVPIYSDPRKTGLHALCPFQERYPEPVLWTFTFIGGGFNQAYGRTWTEALEDARRSIPCMVSKIDINSVKALLTPEEQDTYYKGFPSMD